MHKQREKKKEGRGHCTARTFFFHSILKDKERESVGVEWLNHLNGIVQRGNARGRKKVQRTVEIHPGDDAQGMAGQEWTGKGKMNKACFHLLCDKKKERGRRPVGSST